MSDLISKIGAKISALFGGRRGAKLAAVNALILVVLAALCYAYFHSRSPLVLGIVADIHAGDQKTRDDGIEPENVLFPINYEKNFRSALENMRDADVIITLGDNLNRSGKKHARKLSEIAKEFKVNVLWTKGNHDDPKQFREFLSKENYYYRDKKGWRIIILDNSERFPDYVKAGGMEDIINENGRGFISEEQLKWFKKSLATPKNIIIAMHVPIFYRNNLGEVRPNQENLKEILDRHENVKYVLAGHLHIADWNAEIDGIKYFIIPSLSLKGREGHHLKLNIE
jgi:3',5'-cyclic AMP phosphodiesterase CpdA